MRTCTNRLGRSAVHGPACPEREVSPCPAARGVGAGEYAAAARDALALIDGHSDSPLATALAHIAELAERHRYETAARLRDHTAATIDVLWRGQRLRALTSVEEMVAAAPDGERGWRLAVIRHGQLAAAGVAPRGVPPMPVVDALCAGAQVVLPTAGPLGGALVEETGLIARWLAQPGVRIVRAEPGYCSPVSAAGRWSQWSASARSARLAAEQLSSDRPHRRQSCWVNRAQRASSCSAAPESIASVARARPDSHAGTHLASLDNPACATIAPAAFSSTASRTGPARPAEHRPGLRRVGLGVAADQFGDLGPLESECGRVERQTLDGAGLHPPDRARRRGRQFVEPVVAVHHQHARPAGGEHPGHHLGQIAPRAADQTGPRGGRIRQRPKQVEHRRHPDLAPHHARVPVGRVELRRERESDTHLGHAARHLVGTQIDPHPERFEGVGTT